MNLLDIQTLACGVYGWFLQALIRLCVCTVVALFAVLILRTQTVRDAVARIAALWREASYWMRLVAMSLVFGFVLYAGTKTNSLQLLQMPFTPLATGGTPVVPVVPQSATGGTPVVPVGRDVPASMPFRGAKWNVRGAWNDSFRYAFDDVFVFPFGTGHLDRVEVCSQGRVIPRYGSTDVIASVGVPLQIVNPITSFGCGPTDRNSYIFSWTNAVVGRVLHEDISNAETIDASIELFRSGDVRITTNGVTELIPRIHPSDLDGDGIPDAIDPNPLVCDDDFFGPRDELPPGANTNAYCWVDVVVLNADAEVVFTGDGPSNLPDPHFMARAGMTNRVTVLIGKGYDVQADEAIECVGVSYPAIEVVQTGAESLHVRWPVEVSYEDAVAPALRSPAFLRGGGHGGCLRSFGVVPDWLYGRFEWTTNHCCEITMDDYDFTWDCPGACGCGGCEARGWFIYEGYRVSVFGGECGCGPEPPPSDIPSVGAAFSEDALFYEEAYTNRPGEVVGRRTSTNAMLVCTAYGGHYGGTFSLATANFGKLAKTGGDDLPTDPVSIAPYETRMWYAEYAPLVHSDGTNDVTATATFTEMFSGNVMCATAATTVVKLTLMPSVARQGCNNRHLVGVREAIWCMAMPNAGQWGETGGGELDNGFSTMSYICPLTSDGSSLHYEVGVSRYDFDLTILEPTGLVARLPFARDFGVATNHAGGAGMNLKIYVLPESVSFDGIAMEEIPTLEGVHQDYFSNIAFSNLWYHTIGRGAGRWGKIDRYNVWGEDRAWMGDEMPRELPNGNMTYDMTRGELPNGNMTYDMTRGEWSEGFLVWYIPWGWGDIESVQGDPPVKTMTVRYDQTFTFDEYGTLTVSKFQNTVSRDTNNVIRLNGDIVVGVPLTEDEENEANGSN